MSIVKTSWLKKMWMKTFKEPNREHKNQLSMELTNDYAKYGRKTM